MKLHWNTSAEDLNVEKVIFDKSASRIELSFFVVGVNRWGFDWSDIKLREQTCLYAESEIDQSQTWTSPTTLSRAAYLTNAKQTIILQIRRTHH